MTLLLDSLDETYDRRGPVVSEIEGFLAHISHDTDVLLATRDVAYGHAASLGWPDLRLAAPREITRTVTAVLRQAARQRFGDNADPNPADGWIAERQAWIAEAVESDRSLRETPLLPILLALLAIERDSAALPTSRAQILATVVEDVVKRSKASRPDPFVLGDLRGGSAVAAAVQAFGIEGATILAQGGQCAWSDVVDAVATAFVPDWGLSPGPSRQTAEAAVRFWDASGIFVASGALGTVAPRLMLFAEIADAIVAAQKPEPELRDWVAHKTRTGNAEPLVLAAGLSTIAAQDLATFAASQNDRELLHATIRALLEGAVLDDAWFDPVVTRMLQDAHHGGREGWDSWSMALDLPADRLDATSMLNGLSPFPPPYQLVGRALVELQWKTTAELRANPAVLLSVLGITKLEKLPSRSSDTRIGFRSALIDKRFMKAIEGAADVLLGVNEDAVDLVINQVRSAPFSLQKALVRLLNERGYGELANEALSDKLGRLTAPFAFLRNYDLDAPRKLLTHLSELPGMPMTWTQRVRLDELADLLETLNLNDGATHSWHKHQDELPEIIDLVAALGSFDMGVTASEASVVLNRMAQSADRNESEDTNEPFFALFDRASSRPLINWHAVEDRARAVELLILMLTWGVGDATVAASALWGAPVHDIAVPILRSLIPEMTASTEHQRIAAHVLCSLVEDPEPDIWADHENPVLRAVAAKRCEPKSNGRVSPILRRLLWDHDGYVRAEAVRRIGAIEATDRNELLSLTASAPDPGWMCLGCRTVNEAGQRACVCHRVGPTPASDAATILNDR